MLFVRRASTAGAGPLALPQPQPSRRALFRRGVRALGAIGATAAVAVALDESNSRVGSRSLRVVRAGVETLADYHRHLKGLDRERSPEYKDRLREFNQRTADRLYALCFHNGGIYTKLGQQIATFNHALPREFTDKMAGLQDRAKPVAFEAAMTTVEQELKRPWQEVFPQIGRTPLAAASLAQVHEAVDCHGRRVAVKVQYPHLQAQMKTDLAVIRRAFQAIEYFFPNVQIEWIYPEFEDALRSELDFEHEKSNNRRIAALLRHNSGVHVPEVHDDLSTKKLLVMEFIDAPKISDVDAIEAQGLDPREVAHVLCEAFGEMVFCHGFVHCDPHPGNIFVRRNPDPRAARKTQLVLLDHGLYRELDDGFRRTYCDLWRGMLVRDHALIEDCGRRLNAGEFAAYLPLLFTYRPMRSNSPLAKSLNDDERQALIQNLKQLQFSDVTDFLQQLPRDMLFVFRTNNMIRSLNKELGGSTRDRFATMGKYAVAGHALNHSGAASSSLGSYARYWWEHASLVFHLHVVDWALSTLQWLRGERVKTHRSG
ncbi:hypothetical protein ATCC90586_009051 [Pythium insidiosum]|nr:hypothetical protein ATCC90586_009051 [Pythium insidiosum]